MSELFRIKIDDALVQGRMSRSLRRPISYEEFRYYLLENGILPLGEDWVLSTSSVGYLQPDEILSAEPYDGDLPRVELSGDDPVRFGHIEEAGIGPLPSNSDMGQQIPTLLVGTLRDVDLRMRSLVKRALKSGSWEEALLDAEFVPVAKAPGYLLIGPPGPYFTGDHVHLYLIQDLLMSACRYADRNQWYATQRKMTLDGLNHFWFCLTSMAGVELIHMFHTAVDTSGFAQEALSKILRWWPIFCDLGSRFSFGLNDNGGSYSIGWPHWGNAVYQRCLQMGVPKDEAETMRMMNPLDAGKQMAIWALAYRDH
jgi:hypothetical protein